MKSLLGKLNDVCAQAMQDSAGLTVSRTHYEITVEHFFLKCLEVPDTDLQFILDKLGINQGEFKTVLNEVLEDLKTGNAGKPVFSPLLLELLQTAWLIGSVDLGENRIRSGAVLLAFLSKPGFFSSSGLGRLFKDIGREQLEKQFANLTAGSREAGAIAADSASAQAGGTVPEQESALSKFCNDFTEQARQGKIDAVFGRDQEIRQIVDILARRRKNNPILVGEPGVGKTAVMEGLALRINQNDVPEFLRDVSLMGLDIGALEAGAGMKGEFEKRLRGVIEEIKASAKPNILFIDEAHTLIGSGAAAGSSDAANLLKPALARGELRACAATTWEEYKKYFEKDAALERRFQLVKLDPPSVNTTTLILRGLREVYEKSHQVVIRDDAIQAAAEYADQYISGRFLPDKAIDLLDTSSARVKINLDAKPGKLEDKEREIQALKREHKAMLRDRNNNVAIDEERLKQVQAETERLQIQVDELSTAWKNQQEAARQVLKMRKQLAEAEKEEQEQLTKQLSDLDAQLAKVQGTEPLVQI